MPFPVTQTMAESAEGRMSNKRQIKHLNQYEIQNYRCHNISNDQLITFDGVRFQTVTSWPVCSRALTIREPMLPRPRNPIFSGTVLEMTNSSAELIACDDMMSGR